MGPETRWRRWLYAPDGDGGGDGGGAGGTGGAGSGGTGDPPATSSGAGANGAGTEDRLAVLEAELARARNEAATSRRELAKLKQGQESDAERRERELAEARDAAAKATAGLRSLHLENAVLRRASAHGIVDPEVAARLLELGEEAWDGDKPRADVLDRALRDLVKAKPYLVRAGSAAAGDGGGTGDRRAGGDAGGDMNKVIRAAFGRRVD